MTSAEIVRELRAAVPAAPETLRARIRTLEAPPARTAPSRVPRWARGRRWLVLAVPAAACLAIAAGAVQGVLDQPRASRDAAQPPAGATTDAAIAGAASGQSPPTLETNTTRLNEKASAPPVAGADAAATPRLERYAAQLTLEVADSDAVSKATQEAIAAVRDLGGYVVSAQVSTGTVAQSSLMLRVPHDKAQEAFVRLQGLGKIVQQNVRIDDLQASADQLDRVIANQRARLAVIVDRLATASLDESERARLEAERDLLKSRLAANRRARTGVTNEARTATLQLELRTPENSIVTPVPGRFDRSLDRVVDILALEAAIVATTAAVLLPFLLLGGAIWFGRRGLRRRVEHDLLGA
ncbi:MAG: DUF4349 domain-containing protein [Gaiellales bacterium]